MRVDVRRQREHLCGHHPAADDERGRRRPRRAAAMGGDRLHARRRGCDRDLRGARRRVRPQARLPRRAPALHRFVRADRAVDERRRDHRRSADPGCFGRHDPRLRDEPALGRLLGQGTDAGDHGLGRCFGGGGSNGPAHRRRTRGVERLARAVLARRWDRRRVHPAHARQGAGVTRPGAGPLDRLRRHGSDRRRSRSARPRVQQGRRLGLDVGGHTRVLRRLRRRRRALRGRREAGLGPTSRSRPAPQPDTRRGDVGDSDRRRHASTA